MKFILIFLSLFVFEISLAQENVQEPISEDDEIRYNCPKDPDIDTVEKMMENYIEAKKLGHVRNEFYQPVNPTCLETKLPYPYKVTLPQPVGNDITGWTVPLFVTSHKIKSIRKSRSSSKYSDTYIANVEIKGNDASGDSVEFEDRVRFAIHKDEQAEFIGCISLRGGWTESFMYKRCYLPYAPPHSRVFKIAVAPQINTQVKYNCPQDPDMDTVRKMMENYIEAKKLGHMLSPNFNFVKKECYNTKLPYPYKVIIPKPLDKFTADLTLNYMPLHIFITDHKIKSLTKDVSSNYTDRYTANIEIKGKDQWGNSVKYEDRVRFSIYKGEQGDQRGGCVDSYQWDRYNKPFIYEKCYVKIPVN